MDIFIEKAIALIKLIQGLNIGIVHLLGCLEIKPINILVSQFQQTLSKVQCLIDGMVLFFTDHPIAGHAP